MLPPEVLGYINSFVYGDPRENFQKVMHQLLLTLVHCEMLTLFVLSDFCEEFYGDPDPPYPLSPSMLLFENRCVDDISSIIVFDVMKNGFCKMMHVLCAEEFLGMYYAF